MKIFICNVEVATATIVKKNRKSYSLYVNKTIVFRAETYNECKEYADRLAWTMSVI